MPQLSAQIAFDISAGSLSIVGPLIIYLVFKDRNPVVRQAAAGAFKTAFSLLYVIGWILVLILISIPIALIL